MSTRPDSRIGPNRVSSGSQNPIVSLRVAWAPAAAERTFAESAERRIHAFRPETVFASKWNVELETLAAELGYRTAKATEIQKEFTNLGAAIASA
jgi:hypothetical protein